MDTSLSLSSSFSASFATSTIIPQRVFDLESYISHYTLPSKVLRLMIIAEKVEHLRRDAAVMALELLKSTYNTNTYKKIFEKYQSLDLGEFDAAWVQRKVVESDKKYQKLENDLKPIGVNFQKGMNRFLFLDVSDCNCRNLKSYEWGYW